ncbi:hypothetical protein ASPSYDRAFT_38786 [Aspergillus sydowii CBS 593.65]|uniref:Uncharacterized protein n=1 Tax=Aspergillus sydowii CBS 593.65 TaxID=1036612 RepID=A0A1L9TXD5_9EURO|nr:uncharacterized protein ASPSYDRAFT_38786 [Aspergillus sydowii CBS 593.65]OJJ64099.1 hypothetical protein ASPSYDRAFT_38786 [Aspergillus sydowii CBS 593.65]
MEEGWDELSFIHYEHEHRKLGYWVCCHTAGLGNEYWLKGRYVANTPLQQQLTILQLQQVICFIMR